MTDNRNDGAVPPPPQPATPPPLAGTPPPMAPPQPMPAPYYPAPASGGGTGKWILFIILAFAAGVGATLLTLWLTGDLWNERSNYYPGGYGSSTRLSTGSGSSSYSGSLDTNSASTALQGSGSGTAPAPYTLRGTWGPNCPSSRNDVLTFNDDGTAEGGDGQRGTWSLNGNYVNLSTGNQTLSLYWEMLSDGSARVRRSGDSRTRTVYRCL